MNQRILIGVTLIVLGFTGLASAQTLNISFPIKELGSCANEDACFAYCEQPANYITCTEFGKTHGLIDESEIDPKLIEILTDNGGPGGCNSQIACEAYCSELSHMSVCLAFAEEHGVMDEEDLEEAKRVQAALQAGATLPGGCTNKQSCDRYCEDSTHMQECLSFAEAAGLMSPEELEEAKRILPLMQSGQMPGGCTSKETCEAYCMDETHMEECLEFALKAGFVTPEEVAEIQSTDGENDERMMSGPGGCKDEEECMTYCESPEHWEECMQFQGGPASDEPIIPSYRPDESESDSELFFDEEWEEEAEKYLNEWMDEGSQPPEFEQFAPPPETFQEESLFIEPNDGRE